MNGSESHNKSRAELELRVLYSISQALLHQHEIGSVLREVLDILERDMGLSRGTLTLRRPDSDVFVVEACTGLSSEEKKRLEYKEGEGITGKVAANGLPIVVPDIDRDPDFLDRTGMRGKRKTAFMCVPVIHHRRVIGTISIDRPEASEEDLQRDVNFLKLVSDILAEAVARIREDMDERESLMAENRKLRQQLGDKYHPGSIIGNCSSMRRIYEQIAQVADTAATVLIRGDSGTGKELVARAIHYSSPRKNNPFICVNCAAIAENLIESELFGHEKGAFTGAVEKRTGRFEMANGGTIFLDEIGDISLAVQARLLRVLQERTIERVGSSRTMQLNVRVLAATSRDLEGAMSEGAFREDLYYRLNVFPIMLPPLRDRRSDIMLLADYFLQKYGEAYGKKIKRISSAAINMMMAYHWPGNVRELENCIERAVLTTTDGVIHGYNLPPSIQTSEETHSGILPEEGASMEAMVDSYKREIVIDALKKKRGKATLAAGYLKTTQRVLSYQIKKLGINPGDYKAG